MTKHLMTVTYEIEINAPNKRVAADIVGEGLPRGAQLTALRSIEVVSEKEGQQDV
jgi:hypothetical protein